MPEMYAKVMTERRFGTSRVMIGNGRHDGAVLGDHLAQIARLRQAETADAVEVAVGAAAERPRDLAAAELAERAIQRLV
jgi:hypothetical protein